jgi:hypothetical protein
MRHEYADTTYNLLGLVIEHVRQRPLAEVLRDGVLRVEGTQRLIYRPDEAPTDPMAMPRASHATRSRTAAATFHRSRMRAPTEPREPWRPTRSRSRAGGGRSATVRSSPRPRSPRCRRSTNGDIDYGLGLFDPADGYAEGIGRHQGELFGYMSGPRACPRSRVEDQRGRHCPSFVPEPVQPHQTRRARRIQSHSFAGRGDHGRPPARLPRGSDGPVSLSRRDLRSRQRRYQSCSGPRQDPSSLTPKRTRLRASMLPSIASPRSRPRSDSVVQ